MFLFSKKALRRIAACASALCLATAPVAAYEGEAVAAIAPVTAVSPAQGNVRSASELDTASEAAEAKAVEAKQAAEEAAKEQEKAHAQAEAAKTAAKNVAEQAARRSLIAYQPTYGGTVKYSSARNASEIIRANGSLAGNFKVTFYCPCTQCSGQWGTGTKSGNRAIEGRTIAVDPNVIPLGSRVFVEGFGDFIAEDVGGAIKGNKIDIYLDSHSRCYDLGVQYANVYVMN